MSSNVVEDTRVVSGEECIELHPSTPPINRKGSPKPAKEGIIWN